MKHGKKKLEETYDTSDKNLENKEKDKSKIDEIILNRNICAINSISNLSIYNSIVNHEGTKYDKLCLYYFNEARYR